MKICKFCDVENPDSVTTCTSCGGNEFKNKCGNCGTVFEDGNFCPKCGVKAGAKAKKCPVCGAEYYSTACPECGYIKNGRNAAGVNNITIQTVRPRRTWLWVLGWIFIFPVPLTVLIVKSEKLNKWLKIAIIAVVWIVYLSFGFYGDSDDVDNASVDSSSELGQTTAVEETASSNASDDLYEIADDSDIS